jgi:hypothetical protein
LEILLKILFAKFRLWTLSRSKNYNVSIGNSKSKFIHLYLCTLRSIYIIKEFMHRLVDENLLHGFWWIKNKILWFAKNTWADAIAALENATEFIGNFREAEIFGFILLQFYFGGCDLIDLYYLKGTSIAQAM